MNTAYLGDELRALRDTLGLTDLGRAFMAKHAEIFGDAELPVVGSPLDRNRNLTQLEATLIEIALFASSVSTPADATALADEIAKWLHDETNHPESYPSHTWPETERDDGQREGGFVKIVPLHGQEYFRDIARRLIARFAALRATSQTPDAVRDNLERYEDVWNYAVDAAIRAVTRDGYRGAAACLEDIKKAPLAENHPDKFVRTLSTPSASAGPQSEAVACPTDDQVWDCIRLTFAESIAAKLSFKRWKDGIDIDYPTSEAMSFARQLFAMGFVAHPQPQQADGRGAVKESLHYLWAIKVRLELLYEQSTQDSRLLEHLSDEVDWIDAEIIRLRALQQSPATDSAADQRAHLRDAERVSAKDVPISAKMPGTATIKGNINPGCNHDGVNSERLSDFDGNIDYEGQR